MQQIEGTGRGGKKGRKGGKKNRKFGRGGRSPSKTKYTAQGIREKNKAKKIAKNKKIEVRAKEKRKLREGSQASPDKPDAKQPHSLNI